MPVPTGMRVAAAWAWRLLVLAGLGYVLLFIVGRLSEVVIPVAIALLLCALLSPPLRLLVAWGWHRTLATVTVFLLGLGVVIGLIWVVVAQFIDGYSELSVAGRRRRHQDQTVADRRSARPVRGSDHRAAWTR